MKYKVYIIKCLINKKTYIGRTKLSLTRRFKQHLSKARNNSDFRFHQAINKHGESNFTISELASFNDLEECALAEMRYIADYKSFDYEFGYNSTKGGIGEIRSEESYKKQGEKLKGRKFSKKSKDKMSETLKRRYQSGEVIHPLKGKKMTSEQKKNMKGNTKAGKYNKTLKGSKVLEKTLGVCFYSLRDAANFFNLASTSIARSITNNRTCKRLSFTYI